MHTSPFAGRCHSMGQDPSFMTANLAATLHSCLEICSRLSTWTDSQDSSPISELVRCRVASCVAAVRDFVRYLHNEKRTSSDRYPTEAASLHQQTIRLVDSHIIETLALLSFAGRVDRGGDWEGLDTIYAKQNILGGMNASYSEANCVRRCVRGFGLLEQLNVAMIDPMKALKQIAAHFSPRYIHSYTSRRHCPYVVDATAPSSRGGFGTVRKVRHTLLEHPFAEKSIQNVFHKAERDDIMREIGVLEVCHHRNIVQLIDAFEIEEEPDTIYIVLYPWAPFTLQQFLHSQDNTRQNKCPWFSIDNHESDLIIFRLMNEMAQAVTYLHHLSIKHKDIKPENMLLQHAETNQVTPLLTDVGRSKIFAQGTSTDFSKQGSYEFLSPEQIQALESTLKVDIWQLGCCFAMLLAVASGGTPAVRKLWNSFQDTKSRASCNIALEYESFMKCFSKICLPRCNKSQWKQAYALVTRMLNLTAEDRIGAEAVCETLQTLMST